MLGAAPGSRAPQTTCRVIPWAVQTSHVRRGLAVATLAILVLLGYGGVAAAAAGAGLRPPIAGRGHDADLPWIHVEHPSGQVPYLADETGRREVLRGVVAAGLVDYWTGTDAAVLAPPPHFPVDPDAYAGGACPANDSTTWIPPLCEDDFAQMRSLGLDVVRVALSWSLLEPAPGRYSEAYLARVHQVVGWARAAGLRVILDLHQNAYSRYVGRSSRPPIPGGVAPGLNDYDGAPAWATFTDSLPSEKFLGQREVNPAVFEATTSFWLNRAGIQDRYIAALAALARGFVNDSDVLGYGVYNEPWPGWVPPPAFEDLLLFPFYRRVVDALTGLQDGIPCPAGLPHAPGCAAADLRVHDLRHLLFFDDGLLREVTDFPTHVPLPFTSYANVVLALHAYTHIYTVDRLLGIQHSEWPAYGQSYDWAEREAAAMRAALFVTEFGNDPADDATLLAAQLGEQRARGLGGAFWVWKQNCGYGGTWGLFEGLYPDGTDARCAYDRGGQVVAGQQNGPVRPNRAAAVAGH